MSSDRARTPPSLENRRPAKTWLELSRYMVRRIFIIAITIIVGVYITVLIANGQGQIDWGAERKINRILVSMRYSGEFDGLTEEEAEKAEEQAYQKLADETGLNLPPALRNLKWTWNALRFNWGNVLNRGLTAYGTFHDRFNVKRILKTHFPNTLLLVGAANLIVFSIGIPLALYLASRKLGHGLDRFLSILSPVSSVPSWVHGVFLVAVFAVELRVLPFGGKYDILPAETWYQEMLIVGKHMILPVTAMVFGLFFQLVYAWRTFFMVYSNEDYVDLAVAKGLALRTVERRYIFLPTMPYILTSFALTLVGFWQLTTALEYFFNWPGIGLLYVRALPNFWGESFYPGEMSIVVGIVVTFAYLLGFMVLLLDFIYAWVDPRLRINQRGRSVSAVEPVKKRRLWGRAKSKEIPGFSSTKPTPAPKPPLSERLKSAYINVKAAYKRSLQSLGHIIREIYRAPLALIGLIIILILTGGSIYAVVGLPYVKIGEEWSRTGVTGKIYTPKNAPPVWVNWFRKDDLPRTVVLSSHAGTITKTVQERGDGYNNIEFEMTLDYPYRCFPQDVFLYVYSQYEEKRPFLDIRWITPDGREIKPSSPSATSEFTYFFSDHIYLRKFARWNVRWREWLNVDEKNQPPAFYVMFADPPADKPIALPGTYQMEITAMNFEHGADVEIEFVMLGGVSGWAGTDHMRRDLVVPLFWGLPFALGFGFLGAAVTSIIAMIIAAAGVWFGGWVDHLVQRITEANMILPVLAVSILVFAFYNISLWVILGVVILLKVFSSPTKSFRAAFLQVKEAPYIEAAQAYGASDLRIILKYLIPRIYPVLIPQLVTLIPSLVFMEATLGIFNVFDPRFPTLGRVISGAILENALWGGYEYWVLEPISLLLLAALGFSLFGFALERILNPRLQGK